MPSAKMGGRGRCAIPNYRVKEGHKKGEVYTSDKKIACKTFIRENQYKYTEKLRLISPNS
jgi:hypothetical protein